MTALWRWGKGGFELVAGEETAVLQRTELLQLLQPQLLQHSIFACALSLLLGSCGELQLAGFLLTLMAAILRGALLLQLAAAAHEECTHVLMPILKTLYKQPSLLLDALKNPVAAVQSAWNLSTAAATHAATDALAAAATVFVCSNSSSGNRNNKICMQDPMCSSTSSRQKPQSGPTGHCCSATVAATAVAAAATARHAAATATTGAAAKAAAVSQSQQQKQRRRQKRQQQQQRQQKEQQQHSNN
ncbi:hypothetical protein Emed_005974 [Eimeria media]